MAKESRKKAMPGSIPAPGAASRPATSPAGRDWWWGLGLLLAVVAVYLPVWSAGFVWDDSLVVTNNPCVTGPLGLKEIWTTRAADICPLTTTLFRLEHAFWGLNPLGFHLVNVALQGGCALLLWRVLRALRVPGAWLGAALWAVHPMQVDSVALVAETKNTLSGFFYLLAVLCFVRALGRPGNRRGIWLHALAFVCAVLAMTAKSSTVILPLVFCLCAWWVEGRWQWRNLLRVAPVSAVSVALALVSMWTQNLQAGPGQGKLPGVAPRLAAAGDEVWFYLGKLVWPWPVLAVYPKWRIDPAQIFSWLPLAAAIALLAFLWLKRASKLRPFFFIYAYFLAALLPALGVVNIVYFRLSFVAGHLQYLAAMGPLALVGAGLGRPAGLRPEFRAWMFPAAGTVLLLVLGALSWREAGHYRSEQALWAHVVKWNPESEAAHYNFGDTLLRQGRLHEALAEYEEALRLDPSYADIHVNIGDVFAEMGRPDDAIAEFQQALRMNPGYAEAHYNLGYILDQKGRLDDAIAQYQQAIALKPIYPQAFHNMGVDYYKKGDLARAISLLQVALRLRPDYAEARKNLAVMEAAAARPASPAPSP